MPGIFHYQYLLIPLLVLLSACQPSAQTPQQTMHQQQLFSFGTLIDINILSNDNSQAEQAIAEISAEFDQLHKQWHPWNDGALAQLNHKFSQSSPSQTTPDIIKLIQDSQLLSTQSDGLFNPAIGKLIQLWQFDQLEDEAHHFNLPEQQAIQNLLLPQPQMQDIQIHNGIVSANKQEVSLDFGAFAKGVAIEKAINLLKQHSIQNALINAGGDLKVLGNKNGKPWRIGIKNPLTSQDSTAKTIIAAIDLNNNEALFTSGSYERFFEFQGKHYHHIIDPRTGYPVQGTLSVTVLTEDAALADAASTALFIAGPELWSEIAKKMNIQYVMLMTDDNKIYLTPAMAERIELLTDIVPNIVE
jgi:thiamine biosynthesis lipoprotein